MKEGFMKLSKKSANSERELFLLEHLLEGVHPRVCKINVKENVYQIKSDNMKVELHQPLMMYTMSYDLGLLNNHDCVRKLFFGFYKEGVDIFDLYIDTLNYIDQSYKTAVKVNLDDSLTALLILKEVENFVMKLYSGCLSKVSSYRFDSLKDLQMIKKIYKITSLEEVYVEKIEDIPLSYKEESVYPWAGVEDALEYNDYDITEVPMLSLKVAKLLKGNLSEHELLHLGKIFQLLKIDEYLKVYASLFGKLYFTLQDAFRAFSIVINIPRIRLVDAFIKSAGKEKSKLKDKTKLPLKSYKFTDTYVDDIVIDDSNGKDLVNYKLLADLISVSINSSQVISAFSTQNCHGKKYNYMETQFHKYSNIFNILHIINMLYFHIIKATLKKYGTLEI